MTKMNIKAYKTILRSILIFSFTFLLLPGLTNAQEKAERDLKVLGDSLFRSMNIEELKQIQTEYQIRIDNLSEGQEKTRDRGLEVTEEFLKREGGNIKDQDKILIRLAEYYFDQAEEEYFAQNEDYDLQYEEYLQRLDQYYDGNLAQEPVAPPQPKYDYTRVIEIYNKILTEFPNSDFADDALYTKAYLMQQMNQGVESRKIYQEVIDRYPDSHFAADSYMRLAEYYFDPREDKVDEQNVVELHRAIRLYKKVLLYRDSKRYDEALYKLGWSYYRLSAEDPAYYSDAIIYFLAVIDDITRAEELDPRNLVSNPNVKDEAIEYIGISFSDDESYAHAGVDNARRFIESIGGRKFGVEIMRSLGQTYQSTERNNEAIHAYSALLDMYPYYKDAPLIKQNITETYFSLGDDTAAYRTRDELFRDYNPKSDWYAQIDNSDITDKVEVLKSGHKLSEKALQMNITLDFLKAQEMESGGISTTAMYSRVAKECEDYLEVFPTDSNAYGVNWNYAQILDLKMNRFEEAYEQYIHVSNDYLETDFQKMSANNAIFVADTLVKIAFSGITDTSSMADAGIEIASVNDEEALRPEILTDQEKRLIEAYDNYIRLFPDDENTPKYLANAGAIYFNHKQFAEARVYFKTLVNRFPGAREKTLAYRSIMDSYFYLGQFEDSEFIAKRILQSENIPDEERIFAQKRLAASIFNHAKLYEDQGQFMDAANEFRRVHTEAPEDTVYAEAGLFNSGRNYDKIKEWEKALDTYILLADSYPASKYMISSLKNAAEDNKELKHFSDAAQIYERIYSRQISVPEEAEVALYNAAYYYKEGEDWNNAIRLNNQYIETYPDNPLSTDFYFATAGFYLKLDNLTEANRIYAEFATKYPDDPRGVQAFYERGSYYQDNGQLGLAKAEYQKAITKSETLNQRGMDPNRYYVGEALNKMVDMLYDEYMAIELRQPASNIEGQQARMRGLIKDIASNDLKIIANGSIRSFEAAYRNAEVYELFADKYLNQERNLNLSADQKFVEDKKISDASAGLYDKAVDEYIKAMENIPIIAEKLEVDLFSVDTTETEVAVDTSYSDTLGTVARATEVDSTKEIGLKWYNLASGKISFLYYKEAEITKMSINQAFATTNPYTDAYPAILFQAQLITKLINPAVESTIVAHLKNIDEAKTLNLSNKYVEESKRQILLTSNIPAEEVEKLAYLSLRDYSSQMKEFRRLIEEEYGTLNAKGRDYPVIKDEVQQLIDVSKTLSISAMNSYAQTLQRAEDQGIKNDFVRTTQDRMMRIAVELTDRYEAYHDSAEYWQGYYQTRFDSTENYNYDDAFLFYQEQTFGFTDYEQEILDHAFQLKEQYDINNLWSNKVLAKLIAVDPATYAGAVEREKYIIESDDTWLVSRTYEAGYNREDFDDSGWKNAGIVTSVL